VSEFWQRWWRSLSAARLVPEPAPLNPDGPSAALAEANMVIAGLAATLAERDAEVAGLRQSGSDAADLRAAIGEALNAPGVSFCQGDDLAADVKGLVGKHLKLTHDYVSARRALSAAEGGNAALTARAEQAEATAASLRDGSAALSRRVADAAAALRQIADAPPGTTHAVKTALAAAGLAALAGDAGEAPAGAQDGAQGAAGGFLA
jgi:hypothetical protein